MSSHWVRSSLPMRALARVPLTAAIYVALGSVAFAQTDTTSTTPQASTQPSTPSGKAATLKAVTVTAQKRTENLQKVPISIEVLGTQQLQQQNVHDFADYAKLLPSVSITPISPGFGQIYMRGVASGGDGNHSGSLPSVGVYLDEQPITTIQGPLDLHVYDIQRIEALSGPQGTLYGASSEAGTLRIITNKPDPSGYAAGYSLEANSVDHGGMGNVEEGFVNIPLSPAAAVRLVGWHEHDAGFIDNKLGSRTYPSSGITATNTDQARDNYNGVDTVGARAALKIDLNDNWTITPMIMGQHEKTSGGFAVDPAIGDLAVTHYYPETSNDRWHQAALTVQGKIGNFDLTYAYANLKRDVDSASDYSDYGFWYDTVYGYGAYFYDDNGELVNPAQYIQAKDKYSKSSHELRLASPQDQRFRFVVGLFSQDQKHGIEQRYKVDNLASSLSVTGWEDTIWLTQQERRDRDEAVFGEMSFDFTDKLTGTLGGRYFRADNTLGGFFGFSRGYSATPDPNNPDDAERVIKAYGEAKCDLLYGHDSSQWQKFNGAPCKFFDKEVKESGKLGRANLTYKFDDRKLIYATWSEGFRPGGVQRRSILPNYKADYLTNYEIGWKTGWMDNRLTFNGSIFEEEWKNFQFAVLGLNGLTDIRNAAQAKIRGFESQVNWAATYNLLLSGSVSFYDAKLSADYCGALDTVTGDIVTDCPAGVEVPQTHHIGPEAPKGTQLPVTAKFKGNLNARYTFDIGSMEAYWQATLVHEGKRRSDLRVDQNNLVGNMPGYETVDFAVGVKKNNWSLDLFVKNAFDKRAQLARFTQCAESVCAVGLDTGADPQPGQVYYVPNKPRTIGIRFTQEF